MNQVTLVSALAVALLCCGGFTPARADIVDLVAMIDGAQADAGDGTGSPATGIGLFTLDTETGDVSYNITFDEGMLGGTELFAHVHGPANPDQVAAVVFTLPLGDPKIGAAVLSVPSEVNFMLGGLFYVNIHTETFPAGEIRGQIFVPEPGTMALAVFGLFLLPMRVRRRGRRPR